MTSLEAKTPTSSDSPCPDCTPFLNWNEKGLISESEEAVVFLSLVATVKLQPELDGSLEAKAVKFLKSVKPLRSYCANDFLYSFASLTDKSLRSFIQSIVVLVSSPNHVITSTTMWMLDYLFMTCSPQLGLTLVKADLIPQLINTLNPLSLSVAETSDIHMHLLEIISHSFWLTTSSSLAPLKNKDQKKQEAVHKTVFQQVLIPSEKYICHLCMNRYSIIDGDQSDEILELLIRLLAICPYYQPTMDFVLNMPVFVLITSYLTSFDDDDPIRPFLGGMIDVQREWNEKGGVVQQMSKKILRMLRKEGIEDANEQWLRNDKSHWDGGWIVSYSIEWSNLQGINLPRRG
ncbi:hypothetical protein BLNAU_14930 [Blattamonas nauphoetae]|uniref:Uncharacterized protein n=1 Tax=Blattamonas nauphoetae TaxID=2049346 RepID=A0ABQ9XC93_9EUKA|nr:hypothetical protein BLNAU_14930 [Blattamonas nauphoetae]